MKKIFTRLHMVYLTLLYIAAIISIVLLSCGTMMSAAAAGACRQPIHYTTAPHSALVHLQPVDMKKSKDQPNYVQLLLPAVYPDGCIK